ncbi:hypothetical protein MTR67_043656 [Solanum verrucosum]|uniref:Uncharacterized protein n=1 Tax=Solanum verrucosum TaxID=315347 RepID=A0AAF0URU1_SOLVR|nr:hypothetical protein MTR67_043656 [Solanum verrucosum]
MPLSWVKTIIESVQISIKLNMWCIEGQFPIYFDGKVLNEPQKLIEDDTTLPAPCMSTPVVVPQLGAYRARNVDQADNATIPATTAKTRDPPSTASSHGASSSRATTPSGSALKLVARVKKLETQMATLLLYIRPWM